MCCYVRQGGFRQVVVHVGFYSWGMVVIGGCSVCVVTCIRMGGFRQLWCDNLYIQEDSLTIVGSHLLTSLLSYNLNFLLFSTFTT